ncbi:MAG TPA: response regulator [Campylobacterales bacterium]|nr:response regulator [Campylobacterales bacterium]
MKSSKLSSFFLFIKRIFIKEEKKIDNNQIISKIEENSPNNVSIEKKEFKEKRKTTYDSSKPPTFLNLKALIVEDNPINQKMIKYTLKNIGIDCDIADNGQIGVDMRSKNNYDIIFMDIQMPIMNGIEATQAILKYEKEKNLSHIPIVAVTANALKGDRERFLSEGMDDYVSKPVDFKRLVTVLQRFCSDKQINNNTKDILLYKETQTEAKIISAILQKLGYSVDIAPTIEKFKKEIDFNNYRTAIIDRVKSDTIHQDITQKIKSKNIHSMLFIDDQVSIDSNDKETYTHVTHSITDFKHIQETVNSMLKPL